MTNALILDAAPLLAQADTADPRHGQVASVLRAHAGPLITSQVVAAEADYLILRRLGVDVELAFQDDLAAGTFIAEALSGADLATARELAGRYRDLHLGLADASLIVLAQRHRTTTILTFDHRAFRTVTPIQGGAFTILPDDQPPAR